MTIDYIIMKNSNRTYYTAEYLLNYVAKSLSLDVDMMKSKSRRREFVEARYIYFRFCLMYGRENKKQITLTKMGKLVNRDHSTVLNGLKKYRQFYETDNLFKLKADKLAEL